MLPSCISRLIAVSGGAGGGSRTLFSCLGSTRDSRYTTPAGNRMLIPAKSRGVDKTALQLPVRRRSVLSGVRPISGRPVGRGILREGNIRGQAFKNPGNARAHRGKHQYDHDRLERWTQTAGGGTQQPQRQRRRRLDIAGPGALTFVWLRRRALIGDHAP